MNKKLVLYTILILFLCFFTFKVNFKSKVVNSNKFEKANVEMKFGKDSSKLEEKAKHYTKDIRPKTFGLNEQNLQKNNAEEFSKYPSIADNTLVYKKMYKIHSRNKYGLLNEDGERITNITYDNFTEFDSKLGLYITELKGKFGLIDYTGKVIIPAKYTSIERVGQRDFCIVKNNSYYGLYDIKLAKLVASPIYLSIESIGANDWKIHYTKKFGLIHYKNGNTILIKPKYANIVSETYYLKTIRAGKCGIIDLRDGEIVTEPIYDSIELLNPNDALKENIFIYKIQSDERYGVIFQAEKTSLIIPPIYTKVYYTHGFVKVLSNGNWQTLDKKGNILKNPKVDTTNDE